MTAWIAIALLILVLILFYRIYASLIRYRNHALEALSSIDVQLRQRHDLLPPILQLAHRFITHEKSLLTEVTQLRTEVQKSYTPTDPDAVQQHLHNEAALQNGMQRIFAVAENYPELQSSATFVQAQQTFNSVEGHIAAARRFYNTAVTRLNNRVQIFPGSLVAKILRIRQMPLFELESAEMRKPVHVDDFLAP